MILAIDSQINRRCQQTAQSDDSKKIYFARAKSLNISENVLYDHVDLQQIQAEAFMAVYLLNLSQINRYGFNALRMMSANPVDHGK
jgi:hypothetical protein